MHLKTKVAIGLGILFIINLGKVPARAQGVTTSLSGTVTDSSGKTVPNAKVTAMNAGTGKSTDTQTDASGNYSLPNLTLGLYEVSVSAEGIGSGSAEVALSPGISEQLDISLTAPPAHPPEKSHATRDRATRGSSQRSIEQPEPSIAWRPGILSGGDTSQRARASLAR